MALLIVFGGCGGASRSVKGAGGASSCPPQVTVAPAFIDKEAALYARSDAEVLRCTLQANAAAGQSWLYAATGQDLSDRPLRDQLRWIQSAVRGAQTLTPHALADVGWYLGEQVRRAAGGIYRFDPDKGQPAVAKRGGGGEVVLYPLEVISQAQRCELDLSASLDELSLGDGTSTPATCAPKATLNVVKLRFQEG